MDINTTNERNIAESALKNPPPAQYPQPLKTITWPDLVIPPINLWSVWAIYRNRLTPIERQYFKELQALWDMDNKD